MMNEKRVEVNFVFWSLQFLKDRRLNVWHLALLFAIFTLGVKQNRFQSIKVSRSKMMRLSHIETFPTYHKYIRELQVFGYIRYRPSYHPGIRSEVDLSGGMP